MSPVTYAKNQILRLLPRAEISRVFGRIADHEWSPGLGKAVISAYSRVYDVKFDECVDSYGWPSFDAFFTRRLKDNARPIAEGRGVLVSPADGQIATMSDIDEDSTFLVKGNHYRVADLVGSEAEARRYRGGRGCVVYLSPRDYHRVHSPCRGRVARVCSMPGDFFPVNDFGVQHVPNLFARNRRVSVGIDTPVEDGLGRVTLVFVAALIVGRITLTGIDARDVPLGEPSLDPRWQVDRGGEVGAFHLGSTVVVFVERPAAGQWLANHGPTRFGTPLIASQVTSGAGTRERSSGQKMKTERPTGQNGATG